MGAFPHFSPPPNGLSCRVVLCCVVCCVVLCCIVCCVVVCCVVLCVMCCVLCVVCFVVCITHSSMLVISCFFTHKYWVSSKKWFFPRTPCVRFPKQGSPWEAPV
jgi:hypothetical protein